ncbi:helix-turn-helix domain-containing protein [Geobacillus sp. BMUD]|uniref:transposase n=1 Tax=Geobacillus sp. BMUD TaxID=2508876 RepID=UPI0014922982|nr:transposase [Geobacillus sp. BMUD]NNU85333.1 helix-turn-helix domain-containing protein [Geobacillus sp. BMUD]
MAKPKYDEWLTEEGLMLIEGWARDGLTDEQISQNMGINPSTLYDWKKKHPKISEALKRGKEVVDRQVENALLKRALGYEYDEITYENGKEVKRVRKQVKPDTTAQIFWLKNRKPHEWRDKPENDQLKRIVELLSRLNLSQEEIDELLKEMNNDE